MRYIIGILIVTLFSCSMKSSNSKGNIEKINSQWISYNETINAGKTAFILTFKYPANLVIANIVDNCRCIGHQLKYNNPEDQDPPADSTNTNQWCICMQDSSDFSIDNLISSWKSLYNDQVTEKRDTIKIGNSKALRITLKSIKPSTSYRQLIYLKKYSTLFEIMNTNEATMKDFETFCKSLRIE
jgi:hypothetical protein